MLEKERAWTSPSRHDMCKLQSPRTMFWVRSRPAKDRAMHGKVQAARDIVSVQAGGSGIEQAGDASPFLFQPTQKRTKEHYLNVIGEEDYLNNADKINFVVHSCTVDDQQLAVEAAGAPVPPWFQLPPPKGL